MTAPSVFPQAIHFGPSGSELFGWYHAPTGPWRATGVVLCNPIGDELVRAHRALKELAATLARAGFAVLRFDFHGTGDSSGSERDAGRVARWKSDVGEALAELRRRSGAESLALVGLRLGATVAANAAEGVDSLVLWSPYDSGEAYVYEALRRHQMHRLLEPQSFAAEPIDWDGGGRQALGFLLTSETVEDLRALDLLALPKAPAERVLVIDSANVPSETRLVEQLRGLGAQAETKHLPGQIFLVQEPHKSKLPVEPLRAIVSWLCAHHPIAIGSQAPAGANEAPGAPYGEQPLRFGGSLFGIYSAPAQDSQHSKQGGEKRPAILMLNAGCVHRIGPHRFYVPMARRLAALGFAVLRMDLSGIGDSPAAPGTVENVLYPPGGLDDLRRGLDALAAASGAERFVVLGHFSGADLAYQAALHDPRVVGTILLNPRTFGTFDLATIDKYKHARYYQRSLFRLSSWKKALRGEVDFGRALGMLIPKFTDLAKKRVERVLHRSGSQAPEDDVPASLRKLAERGVDTLLVATENDPGVYYVDVRFGDRMRTLAGVPGFRREDLRGMDHTFTSLFAQERLAQLVAEHVASRHHA